MNFPSTHPKYDKNQMIIVERRMIVPAFLMNDQPRSHMERKRFPIVGRWYAGSSITNGDTSPENIFVFLSMIPEIRMDVIPMK